MFGIVSTILSPIGDVLSEGISENIKTVFGVYYKIPVLLFSILLTTLLYYFTEVYSNKPSTGKSSQKIDRTIILLGPANTGKTVLSYSIINCLANHIGRIIPDKNEYARLSKIIESINDGILPYRNPTGSEKIMKFDFIPNNLDEFRKMKIRTFDFSGEDFHNLATNKRSLSESIENISFDFDQIIQSKNTKVIITLSFGYIEKLDHEIKLFLESLMTKLHVEQEHKIIVVFNKWDLLTQNIPEFAIEHNKENLKTKSILKKHIPEISEYCNLVKIDIIPMSLGKVKFKTSSSSVDKIQFNETSMIPIIEWIQEDIKLNEKTAANNR